MRDWLRNLKNFARRLKMRLSDSEVGAIAGRWLALCLLIAGVAAVGVWGSMGEPGGVNGLLEAALSSQESLEVADNADNTENAENAENGQKKAAQGAEDTVLANGRVVMVDRADTVDTVNTATDTTNDEPSTDDPEVIDGAPEPWVGDAALQAEADLLSLTPPLAQMPQTVQRPFGYGLDKSFGDYRFHSGADWQAEVGTAVLAAVGGEITEIADDVVQGASVTIRSGEKLELVYMGLSPSGDRKIGDRVEAGAKIGEIATSPLFEDVYSPHLHLEIRIDGQAVDPTAYVG